MPVTAASPRVRVEPMSSYETLMSTDRYPQEQEQRRRHEVFHEPLTLLPLIQYSMRQVRSVVQRHQSPERPILHQISGLMYPKIQRRQVIVNVIHPSSAQCEEKSHCEMIGRLAWVVDTSRLCDITTGGYERERQRGRDDNEWA